MGVQGQIRIAIRAQGKQLVEWWLTDSGKLWTPLGGPDQTWFDQLEVTEKRAHLATAGFPERAELLDQVRFPDRAAQTTADRC